LQLRRGIRGRRPRRRRLRHPTRGDARRGAVGGPGGRTSLVGSRSFRTRRRDFNCGRGRRRCRDRRSIDHGRRSLLRGRGRGRSRRGCYVYGRRRVRLRLLRQQRGEGKRGGDQ
jgi:hypothetical protein